MRISAQSETSYDIEHECICLIDSIAPDTIVQFWRFTQANNPGEYTVDVTFDFGGAYLPSGTLLSCKDYYLEDNPGGSGTANTLAMWTGTSSLGNSSVTQQSGTILSSSFTGALKPPGGTTVEQPAGSPGYFRFNTTASGFEGYNGSAYRFLPWADAINPGADRIWFQNSGNTSMTTSSNLVFSGGELRVASSDLGAYKLQVNTAAIFGGSTSSDRCIIGTVGQIDSKVASGGIVNYFENNATANNCIEFKNINTGALAAGKFIQYGNTGIDVQMRDITKAALQITQAIGSAYTNEQYPIQFTLGRNYPGTSGSPQQYNTDSGHGIKWEYYAGSPLSAFYTAARLVPVVVGTSGGHTVAMKIYLGDSSAIREIFRITPDMGVKAFDYGDGLITGTPTYTAAWDVDGKFIEVREKWAAISTSTDGSGDIVVAHGMGATPTSVQVTVTGTTPYVVTVHTIDATNFTVRFYDMAGAAVASTAVTATWHAKT